MTDVLQELYSYRWRNIEFPCASFEVDLTQDHAEHKWPDRDGAHVEGTGRNPLIFKAKALFRNGIKPGKSETQFTVLYPSQYRVFLNACADRSVGTLQHPELGPLQAKCKSASTKWTGERRDGVEVDVVWVEHTDTLDDALTNPSPVQGASAVAAELDAALDTYVVPHETSHGPIPPIARTDGFLKRPPSGLRPATFADLMNGITGIFDQASLFQKQIAGKINEVAYRLDVLSTRIELLRDPQTWPIRASIEHLRDSLNNLRNQLLVSTRPIKVYIVPKDMTLSALASTLNTQVSDLITLNVGLAGSPLVRANTPLRYHPSTQAPGTQAGTQGLSELPSQAARVFRSR